MSRFRRGVLARPTINGRPDPTPAFAEPAYDYVLDSDELPSTEEVLHQDDPLVRVKLFDPQGSWTFYIAAFDPDTGLVSGAVDGHDFELGDFDMNELCELRPRPFRLPLERDLYFEPRPLSVVLSQERSER